MDAAGIERRYRAYIDDINAGRFDQAMRLYHNHVQYNGVPMSAALFRDEMLASLPAWAPGAMVKVVQCLVQGDWLAVRLSIGATPVADWLGLKPPGHRVQLAENTFYHLRDGRIDAVWSVVDLAPLLPKAV